MRRRQLIGGLLALALPAWARASDRGGGGAAWPDRSVDVRVFSDAYGSPIIEEAVRQISRIMPARGPRLNLILSGPADCREVKERRYSRPTITVCDAPYEMDQTWLRSSGGEVKGGRAWVTMDLWEYGGIEADQNTACHELMHAVSWVDDNGAGVDKPDSCVHGLRPTPGPWDKAFLAKVYGKEAARGRKKAKRG